MGQKKLLEAYQIFFAVEALFSEESLFEQRIVNPLVVFLGKSASKLRPLFWPFWSIYLGSCDINGAKAEWQEFVIEIPKELINQVVYDGAWDLHGLDLMFRFVANDGQEADEELFVISEFAFQATKVK